MGEEEESPSSPRPLVDAAAPPPGETDAASHDSDDLDGDGIRDVRPLVFSVRRIGPVGVYDSRKGGIVGLHLPIVVDFVTDRIRSRLLATAIFLIAFSITAALVLSPVLNNPDPRVRQVPAVADWVRRCVRATASHHHFAPFPSFPAIFTPFSCHFPAIFCPLPTAAYVACLC